MKIFLQFFFKFLRFSISLLDERLNFFKAYETVKFNLFQEKFQHTVELWLWFYFFIQNHLTNYFSMMFKVLKLKTCAEYHIKSCFYERLLKWFYLRLKWWCKFIKIFFTCLLTFYFIWSGNSLQWFFYMFINVFLVRFLR